MGWLCVEECRRSFLIVDGLEFRHSAPQHLTYLPSTNPRPSSVTNEPTKQGKYDFERFFSGWFMNAEIKDIRRGNIREMLAWVRLLWMDVWMHDFLCRPHTTSSPLSFTCRPNQNSHIHQPFTNQTNQT